MILLLTGCFIIGLATGIFFFAALRYSVGKTVKLRHPALWTLGSFAVRTAITLVAFYCAAAGDWRRLLACLAGFMIGRLLVIRMTAPEKGGGHATES